MKYFDLKITKESPDGESFRYAISEENEFLFEADDLASLIGVSKKSILIACISEKEGKRAIPLKFIKNNELLPKRGFALFFTVEGVSNFLKLSQERGIVSSRKKSSIEEWAKEIKESLLQKHYVENRVISSVLSPEVNTQESYEIINPEVFVNPVLDSSIRTCLIDGKIWFVSADVCKSLDIKNPRSAVSYLQTDEKGVRSFDTLGGTQSLSIVNESGLYSIIFSSKKEIAIQFRKWITNDVIPSIRKTGSYSVVEARTNIFDDPDKVLQLAQEWHEQKKKILSLEAEIEEKALSTMIGKCFCEDEKSYTFRFIAVTLNQIGFSTGETRLRREFIKFGLLSKKEVTDTRFRPNFMPKSYAVKNKLLTVVLKENERFETRVTGKGVEYIARKFLLSEKRIEMLNDKLVQ